MSRYFLTVEWCNNKKRGIFCDIEGKAFSQEQPHTKEEMEEILGLFWIILSPKSEPFTEEEIKQFNRFIPLAEYTNHFGIALQSFNLKIEEV